MPTSGFPNFIHDVSMARTAPAAAARLVLTKIMAISLFAAVVEPGLKPNQPSQRMNTPRAASGMLCPRIGLTFPSLVYLPSRGPRTMAPARAAQPPTEWTTVEPAKSMKPKSFQPAAAVEQAPPGPAAEYGIDQGADKNTVDQISGKFGSFRHGTGYDGGGRGGKDHLEHPERQNPGIAVRD